MKVLGGWNREKGWVFIYLTFNTLLANSADDKFVIFLLFFHENRIWHFMQIVSIEDNLHKMSKPVFWDV